MVVSWEGIGKHERKEAMKIFSTRGAGSLPTGAGV